MIEEQLDTFGPFLKNPRTLVYMCGLLGMDRGIYLVLIEHDLAGQYITVGDELNDIAPEDWTTKQIKRYVRTTARSMVEVY